MAFEMDEMDVADAVARTKAAGDQSVAEDFDKDVGFVNSSGFGGGSNTGLAAGGKALWGWTKRLPRNVSVGAFRGLLETTETVDDVMAAAPDIMSMDMSDSLEPGSNAQAKPPKEPPPVERAPPLRTMFPGVFESAHEFADEIEANNTSADDLTQGIVQFGIPFTGYLKAFGGLKQGQKLFNAAKALGAEAATAASAFDPHEGRIGDLLQMGREMENQFGALLNKVSPDGSLANDYISYMTDRSNEDEWEGRYKNAVDSLASTVGAAGLLKAVPFSLKAARYGAENMGSTAAGTPKAQAGKIGFHGTPKNFTKFSMDQAQGGAFGHGIYIAENPEQAKKYFTGPDGGVLTVDVPDDSIAGMIRRDAQFKEQPKNVQTAIHELQNQYGSVAVTVLDDNGLFRTTGFADASNGSGAMLYNALAKVLGSEKAASEELLRRGISGMTYADAANSGRNMVIFDDKLPKILARKKAKE